MDQVRLLAITCSGFIIFYSVVAKYMHDVCFVPDPMIMMLFGILVGHHGLGLLHIQYSLSKTLISHSARFLLCLQTMVVALSMPTHYLRRSGQSLFTLVVVSGFLKCIAIFLLLKQFSTLSTATSWAIAASLTPTDPILCSSIIEGRFARKYVPEQLRMLLSAESGMNDCFGIIMLNISVEVLNSHRRPHALKWLAHVFQRLRPKKDFTDQNVMGLLNMLNPECNKECRPEDCYITMLNNSVGKTYGLPIDAFWITEKPLAQEAFGGSHHPEYFGSAGGNQYYNLLFSVIAFIVSTLGVKVLISSVVGYFLGFMTRKLTRAVCAVEVVRSEILLVHAFMLTLLGLSLADLFHGSELICIFFIGTAINSDSWYTLEGSNRKLSELVENLFAKGFFILLGSLLDFDRIPPKLLILALAIVLVTRPLSILAVKRFIPILRDVKEALFIGWFGPIGVGALYYCILYDKEMDTFTFDFAMCIVALSTFMHGISVPFFCLMKRILFLMRSLV